MDQIEDFADERQKAWCIHCGERIAGLETNRDHVPSKSLLLEPYPPNLPIVQICKACNEGFSLDEEYLIAFFGSVLTGSTDPGCQHIPNAARILSRNMGLRTRIDCARTEYMTLGGETRVVWKPESDRINRVVIKNARGHVFFECSEPMLHSPQHVACTPLASLSEEGRRDFEDMGFGSALAEVGSRLMMRQLTGQDLSGNWIIVQDGVYRYAIAQSDVTVVRTVLFEYLATEVRWTH